MYHFLYKTINLVNGKYYFGRHSTSDLEDGYLGSGKSLRHALKKYGKENFSREILGFYPDFSSLVEKEKELVTEEIVLDPKSYNIVLGGQNPIMFGEQNPFFKKKRSEDHKQKMLEGFRKYLASPKGEVYRQKQRKNKKNKGTTGYKHTDEAKAKISAARKKYFQAPIV